MNYQTLSLDSLSIQEAVELFNRGFEGYFVPVQFTVDSFKAFTQRDNVDFKASQVLLGDSRALGVALISCREKASRMGGLGIISKIRGRGAGSWFVRELLAQARQRGESEMHLEVITQNEAALRLYEKYGFVKLRRLLGFKAERPSASADASLQTCGQALVLDLIRAHGLPDLPWQLDAETLSRTESFGYRLGDTFALISDPHPGHVSIRSLLVLPQARRQGQAVRLLKALFAQNPGKTWHVPAIFPEEMGSTFMHAGMQPDTLSQWQMLCKL
jgi:ribosomal protein S18 acetylase RimI-like enzyme